MTEEEEIRAWCGVCPDGLPMDELISLCKDLNVDSRRALVDFKESASRPSGWIPEFDGIVIRLKDWPKLRMAMKQPRLRNLEMTLT